MNVIIIALKGKIMGQTNYKHALFVTAILMAVALIGLPFVEAVFTAAVSIVIGAAMFYGFLVFAKVVDRIIDFLYTAK